MTRDLPRRVFVTVNAPAAERANLRAFAMACALLGISLRPVNSFVRTRRIEEGRPVERFAWYLEQKSGDGQYKAAELWKWWNDPAWLAENPTHPLARFREYAEALRDAEAHEASVPPIAVFSRGKRHAFIPVNLPADRRKQLLEMLEK